jgi:predicted nucleic acid-binding Zn ribbon protein
MMMDNLAKDAKNALKRGMSYGQYMAQKEPEIIIPPEPEDVEMRECKGCGALFPFKGIGFGKCKKYCSEECRERYYYAKKSKETWDKKPHAACAYCGKDFIPITKRNRFCCEDCSYEYRKREWRARNGNNQVL